MTFIYKYKRYISSFLDCTVLILIFFPFTIIADKYVTGEYSKFLQLLIGTPLMTAFFMKDIFYGASPFKKLLGLKVVDTNTLEPITPVKSILRNSTLILLLPFEVIISFFSPRKRIGDLISKSKIIEVDRVSFSELRNELKIKKEKIQIWQMILGTLIIVAIEGIAYNYIYFGIVLW
ncbi:MAG: RDD family protein [Bacteroidales bacterium]|nr:RDD family protein [Bacteroidales bacterium]